MKLTAALVLVLLAGFLAGCGHSTKPSSPSSNDGTAVDMAQANDEMAANPQYVNDDVFAEPTSTMFASAAPAGPADGTPTWFRPVRWWRTIDSTTRKVDIVFTDPDSTGRPTNALATVHRELFGWFHTVLVDSTAPSDSSLQLVNKKLDDNWTRKLALHRFTHRDGDDRDHDGDTTEIVSRWRIVGTSGVLVTSKDATVHIASVRIQAGGLDTTITDPLELHRLRRFPCFRGLTLVHLTVTTDRNDDIVAFYRFGDRRIFHNNGDNTYSIDFIAWDFGGLRHIGVNAFANGTITSETYPYDSQAWLVPHVARDVDDLVASH